MVSELARQLGQFRKQHQAALKPIGKSVTPSFIFDSTQAKNVESAAITDLGRSAIQELGAIDPEVKNYAELFEKEVSRSKLTAEENAKISEEIQRFLIVLSPHFMLSATHQCIEALVRNYQVEQFDMEALLMCALPFHETTQFVRLVQLLNLSNNKLWQCLDAVKSNGAILPRAMLVKWCLKDAARLESICNTVKKTAKMKKVNKPLFTLLTLVGIECLAEGVTEEILRTLLPVLLTAAQCPYMQDLYYSGLGILSELVVRAPCLTEDLSNTLLICLTKYASERILDDLIQFLALFFQTQPTNKLPSKALRSLMNTNMVTETMRDVGKVHDVTNLLVIWLRELLKIVRQWDDSKPMIESTFKAFLKVSRKYRVVVVRVLFDFFHDLSREASKTKTQLDKRCVTMLTEWMQMYHDEDPAGFGQAFTDALKAGKNNDHGPLIEFLRVSLGFGVASGDGSAMAMLPAMSHSAVEVRAKAVSAACKSLSVLDPKSSYANFLSGVLLQRLQDEEEIVSALLNSDIWNIIPSHLALPALHDAMVAAVRENPEDPWAPTFASGLRSVESYIKAATVVLSNHKDADHESFMPLILLGLTGPKELSAAAHQFAVVSSHCIFKDFNKKTKAKEYFQKLAGKPAESLASLRVTGNLSAATLSWVSQMASPPLACMDLAERVWLEKPSGAVPVLSSLLCKLPETSPDMMVRRLRMALSRPAAFQAVLKELIPKAKSSALLCIALEEVTTAASVNAMRLLETSGGEHAMVPSVMLLAMSEQPAMRKAALNFLAKAQLKSATGFVDMMFGCGLTVQKQSAEGSSLKDKSMQKLIEVVKKNQVALEQDPTLLPGLLSAVFTEKNLDVVLFLVANLSCLIPPMQDKVSALLKACPSGITIAALQPHLEAAAKTAIKTNEVSPLFAWVMNSMDVIEATRATAEIFVNKVALPVFKHASASPKVLAEDQDVADIPETDFDKVLSKMLNSCCSQELFDVLEPKLQRVVIRAVLETSSAQLLRSNLLRVAMPLETVASFLPDTKEAAIAELVNVQVMTRKKEFAEANFLASLATGHMPNLLSSISAIADCLGANPELAKAQVGVISSVAKSLTEMSQSLADGRSSGLTSVLLHTASSLAFAAGVVGEKGYAAAEHALQAYISTLASSPPEMDSAMVGALRSTVPKFLPHHESSVRLKAARSLVKHIYAQCQPSVMLLESLVSTLGAEHSLDAALILLASPGSKSELTAKADQCLELLRQFSPEQRLAGLAAAAQSVTWILKPAEFKDTVAPTHLLCQELNDELTVVQQTQMCRVLLLVMDEFLEKDGLAETLEIGAAQRLLKYLCLIEHTLSDIEGQVKVEKLKIAVAKVQQALMSAFHRSHPVALLECVSFVLETADGFAEEEVLATASRNFLFRRTLGNFTKVLTEEPAQEATSKRQRKTKLPLNCEQLYTQLVQRICQRIDGEESDIVVAGWICLDQVASAIAADLPEPFVKHVFPASRKCLEMDSSKDATTKLHAVAGATLCMATLARLLEENALGEANAVVPKLLTLLEQLIANEGIWSKVDLSSDDWELSPAQYICQALHDIIKSLGRYFAPFLDRLLACAVHPFFMQTSLGKSRSLLVDSAKHMVQSLTFEKSLASLQNIAMAIAADLQKKAPQGMDIQVGVKLVNLLSLLGFTINAVEPKHLKKSHDEIVKLYLYLVHLPDKIVQKFLSTNEEKDLPGMIYQRGTNGGLDSVEAGVAAAFAEFATRVPIQQLRSIFDKIHKWARAKRAYICGPKVQPGEKADETVEAAAVEDVDCMEAGKACFFWKMMHALVVKGQDIVAGRYFNDIAKDLVHTLKLCKTKCNAEKPSKRRRGEEAGTKTAWWWCEMAGEALRTAGACFQHMERLGRNTLEDIHEEFTNFVLVAALPGCPDSITSDLQHAILGMLKLCSDDQVSKTILTSFLVQSRNRNPEVRRVVLVICDHLWSKIGTQLLATLSEMLVFLVELLEDEDEGVEAAARQVVKTIETLTGECLADHLKK